MVMDFGLVWDILILIALMIGFIGAWFVLMDTSLPVNSFSILLKGLMCIDMGMTFIWLSHLILKYLYKDYRWLNVNVSISYDYLEFSFFLLGSFISMIPLYMVRFNGSVESVNWILISIVCLVFPMINTALELNEDRTLNLIGICIKFGVTVAIIILSIICYCMTYFYLEQQVKRRKVTRRMSSFILREIQHHKATYLMMNFAKSFALIYMIILVPFLLQNISHIYFLLTKRSQIVYLFFKRAHELTLASNGILHAWALSYSIPMRYKAKENSQNAQNNDQPPVPEMHLSQMGIMSRKTELYTPQTADESHMGILSRHTEGLTAQTADTPLGILHQNVIYMPPNENDTQITEVNQIRDTDRLTKHGESN